MICRICGNPDGNRTYTIREMMFGLRESFTYFECARCGCLQIAEIPGDMTRYYSAQYPAHQHASAKDGLRRLLDSKGERYTLFHEGLLGRLLAIRYPSSLLSLIARTGITCRSRILDVGCGNGALLFALRDAGLADLTGIDPYVVEEATTGPVKILRKTVHELPDDARFDLIMANHSFEHIERQAETLSAFRRLLDQNGVCLIRIPVKTHHIWKLYGVDWVQIDAPRHLFIHTVRSFTTLADKTGFSVSDLVFDSTEFQFWGSEQYRRDIPLLAANSYGIDQRRSQFSGGQMRKFRRKAREMNDARQGDQAAFFLKANARQSPSGPGSQS